MKRPIALMLILAILGLIAWLGADIARDIGARREFAERVARLPALELAMLDDSVRRVGEGERQSVLMFFSTKCPYCRQEIRDLIDHASLFRGADIYLLSSEHPDTLQTYGREAGLTISSTIRIALDSNFAIGEYFGIRKIPTSFVYDSDGELIGRFDGLTRAETIAHALGGSEAGSM